MNINVDITGIDKLEKHIKQVKQMLDMQKNIFKLKEFHEYCINTIKEVAKEQFAITPTTNDDMKQQYLQNNAIRELEDGFEIYNDLTVQSKNYTFSIAMAFEYGVGIVGEQNPKTNHWSYDVNKKTVTFNDGEVRGWWLTKEKAGNVPTFGESRSGKAVIIQGYEGMEIYRKSRERIIANMEKWYSDYINKIRNEV